MPGDPIMRDSCHLPLWLVHPRPVLRFVVSCRACPEPRTGRERVVVSASHAADEQKALHVPPGFEIQLVASEPDIHKPLNLAFDDRGRLWVTDTVEYPYPARGGNATS